MSTATIDYSATNLNAVELCLYLQDNGLNDIYRTMPAEWIAQAQSGYNMFEVHTEHLMLNLVRLQLHSPKVTSRGVSVKFKLSALMDSFTGELCDWASFAGPGEQFINFTSKSQVIKKSLLSSKDYALLVEYSEWWAAQEGLNMFDSSNCGKRLWIEPAPNFEFQFQLDVRLNPKTKENCLGLGGISMKGISFLDTFGTGRQEEDVTAAKKQRTGRRKLEAAKAIKAPRR